MRFWKKRKFWKRLIIFTVVVPILLLGILIGVLYWQQDKIVQHILSSFNEDFTGELEFRDSHISPFSNFPHITVDLEDVKIWEGKDKHNIRPIVEVEDIYIGFNLFSIISGKFEIDYIKMSNGEFDLIKHKDGSFNVANALSNPNPEEEDAEVSDAADDFNLNLKKIILKNLDVHQMDESNGMDIETYMQEADIAFKTAPEHLMIDMESKFVLNILSNGDTTFIRHKHFDVNTHFDLNKNTNLLTLNPSKIILEHGEFGMDGTIDLEDSINLDLKLHGEKPNFDLFIAFAPEELIPTLERYDNAGRIFFEASAKGKSLGKIPEFVLDFGCEKAWFLNTDTDSKVEKLQFKGHLANTLSGAHDLSSMEFSLKDFNANPKAGFIKADIEVKNFESPDINMVLDTEFDLPFLKKFFNLETVENLDGEIKLHMKFHDIIDLDNPEKAIERMNEAYETELLVNNLTFTAAGLPAPIKKINAKMHMDGHEADIDYFDIVFGNSDLHIDGLISDLPAVIHHTDREIDTRLNIRSKFLDIRELTTSTEPGDSASKPFDEQIENLMMKLDFKSSAKAFTESKYLPEGEFFIEDLYATLKHYPHTFHDFHADVYIDENDFRIVDFSGELDTSDFHFTGKLHDYGFWFGDNLQGDTRIEFDLTSDHLRLEDIFSYGDENMVPEDYRHEELQGLKIHGLTDLHFKGDFHSADVRLTQVDAKMKVHPLKFQNFKGRIHFEDDHIQIDTLYGQIGKSSFTMDLNYYLGDNEAIRKRDNHLGIHAKRLDFDELLQFNPPPTDEATGSVDHEAGFNIYDLPFSPMTFDIDIGHLNYHRYTIHNFKTKIRMERDHFLRVDTLSMNAAGGLITMVGYFDGRDRNKIYLDPRMRFYGVDLDKLLFKFENFGQDHLVSENLHGELTGVVTGHIHVHPDLVPKIDDSEIHMDIEVLNGSLNDFEPLVALSDYFGDKNMNKVRFDSLINHLDVTNGTLNMPNMTLNTTIGHMDIAGEQQITGKMDMEYYVRVPMKMVSGVAKQKLFKKKNKEEAESAADAEAEEEEIIYKDQTKKTRYLNLTIKGNPDEFKVGLGKDKRAKQRRKEQKKADKAARKAAKKEGKKAGDS